MQIDDKFISSMEDQTYISLSADEKSRLAGEFQQILDSVAVLGNLNLDGVPECTHPLDNVNVFRDDKALPSHDRELILKNAPRRNDEFFIAPKTVE
jgi:aspartyl-tRNA(Asn)/glutamyl-tRNA(Gln) amidotransferase subunit C